jgi:hypothetical protein
LNAERGKPGHGSRNGNLPALLPSTTRSSSPPSLTPRAHPPPAFGFVERFHSPRAVPRRTMHGPRAGLRAACITSCHLNPQPGNFWNQRRRRRQSRFDSRDFAKIPPSHSNKSNRTLHRSHQLHHHLTTTLQNPHIEQFNQSMFKQNILIISNNSINPCSNKTINHNRKKFEPRTDYQQPINFTYRMDYWMNAIEQDLTPEFQIQGNDPRGR